MNVDMHLTIKFIEEYRVVEKAKVGLGEKMISDIWEDDSHKANHLCESWAGRKNDWGDFYLNLTPDAQYKVLKWWELQTTDGDKYVEEMESDPFKMLFTPRPYVIYWPYELLKFFYNNDITETPADGVILTKLPHPDKSQRGTANWGDYILSLNRLEREIILNNIAKYIEKWVKD